MPKPKRETKNSPDKAVAQERRITAMKMREAGATYQQIADSLGVTRPRAFQIVTAEYEALQKECCEHAERLRTIQHHRLEAMLIKQFQAAVEGDTEAVKNVINMMGREAKLMGLDAPTQIEGTGGGIQIIIPESLKGILEGTVKTTAGEGADASGDTRG